MPWRTMARTGDFAISIVVPHPAKLLGGFLITFLGSLMELEEILSYLSRVGNINSAIPYFTDDNVMDTTVTRACADRATR
jgi:hypothetical protein